jgi:hypothetical protein
LDHGFISRNPRVSLEKLPAKGYLLILIIDFESDGSHQFKAKEKEKPGHLLFTRSVAAMAAAMSSPELLENEIPAIPDQWKSIRKKQGTT